MNHLNWKTQLKNCLTDLEQITPFLKINQQEKEGALIAKDKFPFKATEYYLSLIDKKNKNCPIRKQIIPDAKEVIVQDKESLDPLREEQNSPVPNIIKVYPDRIAFCVADRCAVSCRYCLRKRLSDKKSVTKKTIQNGIQYIKQNKNIRDVLLTGGDPLIHDDDFLEYLLSSLKKIKHIEILRIGTRMPCVLPDRITPKLCKMLKKYHPLWINTQFNHPKEITKDSAQACQRLIDAGIPLGNQSVLLKGINDNVSVMKKLLHELIKIRVRPYYVYQCQTLTGAFHFTTKIEDGIELFSKLRGYTTGFSLPLYVLDTPYGKIPLTKNYFLNRKKDFVALESYNNRIWEEYNP